MKDQQNDTTNIHSAILLNQDPKLPPPPQTYPLK